MKRIKDQMDGETRTPEQMRRVTRPELIRGAEPWGHESQDRSIDRAPGSDDAFPSAKMPEFDFFDR